MQQFSGIKCCEYICNCYGIKNNKILCNSM